METFSHIQNKLSEFESDIRTKTLNQDVNNQEYENKIQQIDIKLDNTLKFMKEIKFNNDIVMDKIIKLENTINANDIKGQEILTGLEKINVINNNDKRENISYVINRYKKYFYIPMYSDIDNILIWILTGSCIVGTYFGIKYILRKN